MKIKGVITGVEQKHAWMLVNWVTGNPASPWNHLPKGSQLYHQDQRHSDGLKGSVWCEHVSFKLGKR